MGHRFRVYRLMGQHQKRLPGYYENCYPERQLIAAFTVWKLSISRVKPFVVTR